MIGYSPDPYAPTLPKQHYADMLDELSAQLEDTQAAFNALAENAASAYAVLGAVILAKMPEEAARYSGCTPAQMVDGLVQGLGEDELIEALTSAL